MSQCIDGTFKEKRVVYGPGENFTDLSMYLRQSFFSFNQKTH